MTKRIAQNATTDALTQHLSEAIDHSQMMREDANRATTVTTITQMIGLGIIPAGQANAAVPGLMDDDGVMDASKLDGAALVGAIVTSRVHGTAGPLTPEDVLAWVPRAPERLGFLPELLG